MGMSSSQTAPSVATLIPTTTATASKPISTRRSSSRTKARKTIRLQSDQPWYTIERADTSFDLLRRTEWMLVDGLGGYAMGTALGLNTKRYHGLFIHAAHRPLGRVMHVNAVAERLIISPNTNGAEIHDLSLHEFADGTIGPGSFDHFVRFEKGFEFCRWTWRVSDIEIQRELRLNYRVGGAIVHYSIQRLRKKDDERAITLELRPLARLGNHHNLHLHATDSFRRATAPIGKAGVAITGSADELYAFVDSGEFHFDEQVWYDFKYAEETARGLDDHEDLFNPGFFRFEFAPNSPTSEFQIRLCTSREHSRQGVIWGARTDHLKTIVDRMSESNPLTVKKHLALIAASDDFVVPRRVRGRELKTILAGYPWFSDWGRDTCICIPGILLATNRHDEALDVLRAFAEYRKYGLIPNVFDDVGGAAHYNTVDAPLWFCHAACEYLKMTGDHSGFDEYLRDACLDIIANYQHGTEFNIHMDPDDGLIVAGDESTQLTWMDARRDGVTFTPRHGKAVEINALWYHALLAVGEAIKPDDEEGAQRLFDLARYVGPNLRETFWCSKTQCLYDCIFPEKDRAGKSEWKCDASIRPNQLLAVSLPHSAFNDRQKKLIVRVCERELLTPVGMRTLSPNDPKYRPRFEGDMFSRDGAYHQGTVWPWLIGPFLEAHLRSYNASQSSIRKCKSILKRLLDEMNPPTKSSAFHGVTSVRSLGQLYEVYDADETAGRARMPGGCMAQAWSVAEPLRILTLIERLERGETTLSEST